MIRKLLLTLALTGALAETHAAQVTWQAATDIGLAADANINLEVGSLVRLGWFDVSLSIVEDPLHANDRPYLESHFHMIDYDSVGGAEIGGLLGYFSDQSPFYDTKPTGGVNSAIAGQLLYVWAFKSSDNSSFNASYNTATRTALFTVNTSNWLIPTDPDNGAPNTTSFDINELANGTQTGLAANAHLIQGTFPTTAPDQGGGTKFIGLVAVPEPSSALLAAVGLLGLVRRRR